MNTEKSSKMQCWMLNRYFNINSRYQLWTKLKVQHISLGLSIMLSSLTDGVVITDASMSQTHYHLSGRKEKEENNVEREVELWVIPGGNWDCERLMMMTSMNTRQPEIQPPKTSETTGDQKNRSTQYWNICVLIINKNINKLYVCINTKYSDITV